MDNMQSVLEYLEYLKTYMPGLFYWKDKAGRYLGCNDYFKMRHPNVTREMLIGKTDAEIWPSKSQADALRRNDQYVMQTGIPLEIEEKLVFPGDDHPKYFATVKMPLKDHEGNTIGVIGNSSDITEQKRAERALQQSQHQMAAAKIALQTKSDFIVNVSQDCKVPLHSIIGMSQALLLQKHLPHQQELLQSIFDSANLMLEFTEEVLEISELDAIALRQESFNLKKLLDDLINMLGHEARIKQITLENNYHVKMPTEVCGDVKIVKRIIWHMLEYALRNTTAKCIKVVTQTVSAVTGNVVRIKITIPELNVTQMQNNKILGMTIIKQLVALHGGNTTIKEDSLCCELQCTVSQTVMVV